MHSISGAQLGEEGDDFLRVQSVRNSVHNLFPIRLDEALVPLSEARAKGTILVVTPKFYNGKLSMI